MKNATDNIDVADIDNAIQMLNKYAMETGRRLQRVFAEQMGK